MSKNMMRTICVLLVLMLCFGMTACGSSSGGIGSIGMDDTEKGELPPLGGGGANGEPAPSQDGEPTPDSSETTPTQQPQSGLETEAYQGEYFTATIPKGWQVYYEAFDSGEETMRIVLCIIDPENINNRIFYTTGIEPFFVSEAAKNALLPYLPSSMEWAPVMDGTPSAEETIRLWPHVYNVLQADGEGHEQYFGNYVLNTVIDTTEYSSSSSGVYSAVLAAVDIQGSSGLYDMYFENTLVLMDLGSGIQYYTSQANVGVVVEDALFSDYFETMLACAASLEFFGL